jgi:hypothetical protein
MLEFDVKEGRALQLTQRIDFDGNLMLHSEDEFSKWEIEQSYTSQRAIYLSLAGQYQVDLMFFVADLLHNRAMVAVAAIIPRQVTHSHPFKTVQPLTTTFLFPTGSDHDPTDLVVGKHCHRQSWLLRLPGSFLPIVFGSWEVRVQTLFCFSVRR